MTAVLGIKMRGHDPGAALICDGRLVAISEERLNRIKYSKGIFPTKAIQYCLDAFGLSPDDIDLVVSDRTVENKGGREGASKELFTRNTGNRFDDSRFLCINHHSAHAATAFLCSPFEDAAILVYDGNGDHITTRLGVVGVETETLYRGVGSTITEIDKSLHVKAGGDFPYGSGIGKLYAFLSRRYLRFGPNNEWKMMGLAAYGDDRILKEYPYEAWVRWDGGQLVATRNIRFSRSVPGAPGVARSARMALLALSDRLQSWLLLARQALARRILPDARTPVSFPPIVMGLPARDPAKVSLPDEYYSSVAYAAQKIFEHYAIELGRRLRTITGSGNLCVSGGCGLNIDANRNFLTEVGYRNIFVQPASNDSGIPLGCALWGWHVELGQPRTWEMRSASLGRPYSKQEIEGAILERRDELEWRTSADAAEETAQILADGKIVGWYRGGAEYGPRALGNRSILCDPRPVEMKDRLNARVKHREMWRPFAAAVLLSEMSEWFELEKESPFMLLMAPVREEKRSAIPAVVHRDGTCRIQSLTERENGDYWKLVKAFGDLTGVPLVLNTSFNIAGDPIVETPQDAIDTFLRTGIDVLVLEDFIVTKRS
jgi:carbamoyltransferase